MSNVVIKTIPIVASDIQSITDPTLREFFFSSTGDLTNIAESTNENNEKIEENSKNIAENKTKIISNTQNIEINRQNIEVNKQAIDTNRRNIEINTQDIEINKENIESTKKELDTHVNSKSQHGATGDIIGNENFCTDVLGGVVLLCDNVTKLDIIQPIEIPSAPANYNQEYVNNLATVINNNHIALIKIVEKVNEIIEKQIAAKQVANVRE